MSTDNRSGAAGPSGRVPGDLRVSRRSHIASALLAVSTLIAIGVVLDEIGSPGRVWDIVQDAQWGWVAAAVVISLSTNIPYAVALKGTVATRVPLWPTTEVQLAVTYINVLIPVVGGTLLQIRFLQRRGVELPAAVAAVGVLSPAGAVITELPLFALAVALSPDDLHLQRVAVGGVLRAVIIVAVLLALGAAAILSIRRTRRHAWQPVIEGVTAIGSVLRSPRQVSMVVGGKLTASLLYGLCLGLCLRAFEAHLPYSTVLAVSIATSSVAAIIPLPGGNTGAGTVALTAVLVLLGIPARTAVPVSLASQLTVNYLPAIPGWFATRHLLGQLV